MKKFEEFTNEQLFTIAALALEDIVTWSNLQQFLAGASTDTKLRIEKAVWNKEPELSVYRVYVDGMGDTWCAIWQLDDENIIDVTVVEDKDVAEVANKARIYKRLMEWGFMEGPNYLVREVNHIREAIKQIKEDSDLFRSWKDNIAMSFKDRWYQEFDKLDRQEFPDQLVIHTLANDAAENFLNLLCKDDKD